MLKISCNWKKLSLLQRKVLLGIVYRGGNYDAHVITNKSGMHCRTIFKEMLTQEEQVKHKSCNDFEKNVLEPMVDNIIFGTFSQGDKTQVMYGLTEEGFLFVRKQKFILYKWHYDYKWKSHESYQYFRTTLFPILVTAFLTGIATALCTVFANKYFK